MKNYPDNPFPHQKKSVLISAKATFLLATFMTIFALLISPATAQIEESEQGDDIPLLNPEQEETLDTGQQKASEFILDAADWFDNFFDNGRFTAEENKTRAKLVLKFGYTKNDDFEFSPRVNWKIHLPKLSKRANLIISANDDEDFKADDTPSSAIQDDKNELAAAIQYFLKEGEKYNISTTFGVSTNYVYAGLRLRRFHDFGPWQGRFIDRLRYYTDDGWENKASYDLERQISDKWLFRTTAAVDWFEWEDGLPHSLKFKFYQVIDKVRAVSYEWDNFWDTEPSHKMTDLQLRIRYRQRFYRDWLVLELSPQISFPEEYNRDPDPGIILKLEADFGYIGGKEVFSNIFR